MDNVGLMPKLGMGYLTPALDLIKEYEGCKLHAYLDICGVPTIGYGTTYIDNKPVTINLSITQDEAESLLWDDCMTLSQRIQKLIPRELNRNEMCALVSFCYNVGMGTFFRSTLLRLIKDDAKEDEIVRQIKLYDHAGGRVIQGLVTRRTQEANLWTKPSSI